MTIFLYFLGSAQMDPGSQTFFLRYKLNPAKPKRIMITIVKGTLKKSNFESTAAPETPRMVRTNGPIQHSDAKKPATTPVPIKIPVLFSIG